MTESAAATAPSSVSHPAASGDGKSISAADATSEHLRQHLQSLLAALKKREPLDPNYDSLLPSNLRKRLATVASGGGSGNSKLSKPDNDTNKDDDKIAPGGGKKSNVLTADAKLRRRFHAHLRTTVETYASTPAGWRRRPNTRRTDIDFGGSSSSSSSAAGSGTNSANSSSILGTNPDDVGAKLRAAFALRESKEHEQRDLVAATLKAENAKLRRAWGLSQVTAMGGAAGGMGAPNAQFGLPPLEGAAARKKRLDGIAKQLRDVEKGSVERSKWAKVASKGREYIFIPRSASTSASTTSTSDITTKSVVNRESAEDREAKRKREESELQHRLEVEQAKKRERGLRERLEREEAEKNRRIEKEREERERRERAVETPQDALHRLYEPIFSALWDMEFANLGGTNPFRMVIDASNCAQMGIPDYCDVIKRPMNLTYIQTKVNDKSYETLQEFLEDLDLIVKNALLYNSNPENEFHIAAKELRRRFKKLVKPVIQSLTKGQKSSQKES